MKYDLFQKAVLTRIDTSKRLIRLKPLLTWLVNLKVSTIQRLALFVTSVLTCHVIFDVTYIVDVKDASRTHTLRDIAKA